MRRLLKSFGVAAAAACVAATATAAELTPVRVAVLKFGTVNWELNVIKHHGLDHANGIDLQVLGLAGDQATKVALQAGEADMIVSDWLWVSRQRADRVDLTFLPYSRAVGALMVPPDSPVRSLADLKGLKVGIAGGPLDKSWLLLRAVARQEHGIDLDADTETVFGAPPLLNQQIESGKIDAVINYWHFVARLEAKDYRPVITVSDALGKLGVTADVPMLGYVFSEAWGLANDDAVAGFAAASRQAKQILGKSDDEWERLRDVTKAGDDRTLAALREGYRAGIPARWGEAERADAERVFALLADLGGERLVGKSPVLQPGTFWPASMY